MKDTLMGRAIGILIAEGSDGAVIKEVRKAATRQWYREESVRSLA
jgi:catalase